MTNKLLGDKGGLHNRVTRPIRLAPFCLAETEEYLQSIDIEWERQEILDAYMILGGTPFYLSLLNPMLSLRQNIDELFFGQDPILASEYDFLFKSLFNDAALYKKIVETLAGKLKGLTREELVLALGTNNNGKLSEVLDNLKKCDFLRSYQAFGKRERECCFNCPTCTRCFTFVSSRTTRDWTTMLGAICRMASEILGQAMPLSKSASCISIKSSEL